MESISFSSVIPSKEDIQKEIELAKKFLEEMNDEVDDDTFLWKTLATKFPGKSLEEIEEQCNASIEEYKVAMLGLLPSLDSTNHNMPCEVDGVQEPPPIIAANPSTRELIAILREGLPNQGSTKGLLWSVEEQSLFLLGLECFGKGDWKNISKYFVLSRTPTQIASHAQKFFNRKGKRQEAHYPSTCDINIATQVQYLPTYLKNGFHESSVGFNRQPMMSIPTNVCQILSPLGTQQFLAYYPNPSVLMMQNTNKSSGL